MKRVGDVTRQAMRVLIVACLLAMAGLTRAAPVDVNQATQAQLESVSGIGPSLSSAILDERRKRAFRDWRDLVARVKGIGGSSAAKFSAAGLTVNGDPYRATDE
jgi:competence protein ComEA